MQHPFPPHRTASLSLASLALALTVSVAPVPAVCAAPAARAASAAPMAPATPAVPVAEYTEVWEGKVLSATYRVGMCTRADGTVRGVFLLTHRSGETDVYHLNGSVRDHSLTARHHSGHELTADLRDPSTVRGKMRLKNGMSFSLDARRHPNAPVTDDCAPLPRP